MAPLHVAKLTVLKVEPVLGVSFNVESKEQNTRPHFTDIDECDPANPVHDCDLGSTDCIDMVGSFRCDCLPGYTNLNSTTNSCEGNHGYRKEITFDKSVATAFGGFT